MAGSVSHCQLSPFCLSHGQHVSLGDTQGRRVALRVGGVLKENRVLRVNLGRGVCTENKCIVLLCSLTIIGNTDAVRSDGS